jgi:transcription antitermination factor NusG
MACWTAARLKPQRESLALTMLAFRGFETYRPCIQERRTVRGRRTLVTSALFPLYAFIAIEAAWYDIRYCPGVACLLMGGDKPVRVPDRDIEALRAQELDGVIVLPEAPPPVTSAARPRRACGSSGRRPGALHERDRHQASKRSNQDVQGLYPLVAERRT